MNILIYYHHGLGDCIMLTPQLRYLHHKYKDVNIDLMCRKSVKTSHLFDNCPFIRNLIIVPNPWKGDFNKLIWHNYVEFKKISKKYDKAYFIDHIYVRNNLHKVQLNSLKLNIKESIDYQPQVFISKETRRQAQSFIDKYYPNGYIFRHTEIDLHPIHNWDASEWIRCNLPSLPIIDTGFQKKHYLLNENINFTFYLLKKANYIVLSLSVMVHAADAMKKEITVLNKGNETVYALPINKELVKNLRVKGEFKGENSFYEKVLVFHRPKNINKIFISFKENIVRAKKMLGYCLKILKMKNKLV